MFLVKKKAAKGFRLRCATIAGAGLVLLDRLYAKTLTKGSDDANRPTVSLCTFLKTNSALGLISAFLLKLLPPGLSGIYWLDLVGF